MLSFYVQKERSDLSKTMGGWDACFLQNLRPQEKTWNGKRKKKGVRTPINLMKHQRKESRKQQKSRKGD